MYINLIFSLSLHQIGNSILTYYLFSRLLDTVHIAFSSILTGVSFRWMYFNPEGFEFEDEEVITPNFNLYYTR